jgi:hypothetical protein
MSLLINASESVPDGSHDNHIAQTKKLQMQLHVASLEHCGRRCCSPEQFSDLRDREQVLSSRRGSIRKKNPGADHSGIPNKVKRIDER